MSMSMKKIIPLLLALVMVLCVFASCQKEPDATPTTTPGDNTPTQGQPTATESGSGTPPEPTKSEYEKIGIPTVNYNDSTIHIFHWNSEKNEFDMTADEAGADPIDNAIFDRNLKTQQLLGVELSFFESRGDGGAQEEFVSALSARISDPTTPVDIVATYPRTMGIAMLQGLMTDLNSYEDLDLTKEWWPKNLQEEFDLNGRLYFVSGDISTNLLHMMYATFFNRTQLEAFGTPVTSLINMVKEKEWTISKLYEITHGVYSDADNSGEQSEGDFYGCTFRYYDLDAFWQGTGYKMMARNTDETTREESPLVFDSDFFGETVGKFMKEANAWVTSADTYLSGNDGIFASIFKNGNAIFCFNRSIYGFDLQNADVKYGVVPMPMLDPERQGNYNTCLGNPYTLYGICVKSPDPDRAAVVLQTLGYYGKELTTPAIFDVTYQGKWAKEADMLEMFNVVRSGISFELGRIYFKQMNYLPDIVTGCMTGDGIWANTWSAFQTSMAKNNLKKLNKNIVKVLSE